MAGLFDDLKVGGDEASNTPVVQGLFDDLKAPRSAEGVTDTLWEGTKSAGRALGATVDAYTGDNQGIAEKAQAQQAAPKDARVEKFQQDFAQRTEALGEDPGVLDTIGEGLGAVWDNPAGAGLAVVEQLPNAVPTLAGGFAGMKAGAAAGAAVGAPFAGVGAGPGAAIGGVVGGLAGMFLGNTAIETGHKAMGMADDGVVTDEERGQAIEEGAVKGAVITGVDALTLGAGGKVAGALQRTTSRAMESATRKALVDRGVDVADEAAVLAARSNPEIAAAVRAAQENARAATDKLGKRMATGGALLGMETVGEGVGEYLGELAATGEGNVPDAVLESLLSLGQSGAETAWNLSRTKARPDALVQPTPTAENPNPAPVERPDPSAGPLSAAANRLPAPSIAGALPAPDQTLYADGLGNVSSDGPARDVDREYRPVPVREQAVRDFGPGMDQQVERGILPVSGELIPAAPVQRDQPVAEPRTFDAAPVRQGIPDLRQDSIAVDSAGNAVPGKIANVPPADYVQGGRGMDQQAPVGKSYSNVLAAKNAISKAENPSLLEVVPVGPKQFEVRTKQSAAPGITVQAPDVAVEAPASQSAAETVAVAVPETAQVKKVAAVEPPPAATDKAVLPEVLRHPKKLTIAKMMKASGVKKGSPGYETAIARLDLEYERQVDDAYAGLSFEQFHALNKGSPEGVNRKAWRALRQERGIEDAASPVATGGAEPAGAAVAQQQPDTGKAQAESGQRALEAAAHEAAISPRNELHEPTEAQQQAEHKAKIQDFGEKIGGARKDRAISAGPRPARASDNDARPAWARRFDISEVVSSTNAAEVGRWEVRDNRLKDRMKQPKKVGSYATREEAEQAVPLIAVAQKHRVVSQRQGDGEGFEIWRTISDHKRVKVVDQVFPSREAAMEYMATNAQQIVETNTTFGEADLPRPENAQRIGAARREGPVKDSAFIDTFGFRGVEFGNWNNQEERQQLLDDAYDGLLDLAEVMDIPPKAISLNGELALAFGARGHGLSGARAHYEPAKAAINLTKMNGAGSLAHEWFHALDHYFGRQDGKASAEWVIDEDGTRSLKTSGSFEREAVSSGFRRSASGVRAEVRQAYTELMKTMTIKAEQYVEDTARADDFVARARKEVSDRIDRLRVDLADQKDPKYWKRHNKPASAEQLAAFDTVAQQILDGVQLETELRSTKPDAPVRRRNAFSGMRWTNDALEQISAIYKAVRGRSGFNADNNGELDRLRGVMSGYSSRLKMLADAQKGGEKTKQVPTQFAMDAKELDQGRGTDYWTTPHEMAARAFQGYVEDMVAERGGKSPFLNFGPENVGIPTPWGWKRPFPAGEERKAINEAFTKLVQAIENRETEYGNVALYRLSADTRAAYEARIDDLFAGAEPNNTAGVRVLDRSDVLDLLGYGDREVVLAEKHAVSDGRFNHPQFTVADWKKVPEWMENPVAVFERDDGHLTVIAPETKGGEPIIIGINPDARQAGYAGGKRLHVVLSAYNKDRGRLPIERMVRDGQLRYVDTRKSPAFNDSSGHRLPSNVAELRGLGKKVYTGADLFKYRSANSAADVPQLRLNPGKVRGIPSFSAKAIARQVQEASGLRAVVVDNEFALPGDVLEQVLRDGVVGRVAGLYYRGTAYLVASNLQSVKHAQEVLLHEVVGHQGVRAVLGTRTGQVMQQIYAGMPAAERQELESRYAGQLQNMDEQERQITVAEEYVAHLAETNPQHSVIQRLLALVRAFLRRVFGAKGALHWTSADIVALLADSRRLINRGAPAAEATLQPAGAVSYRQNPLGPTAAGLLQVEEVDEAEFVASLKDEGAVRSIAHSLYRARGTDSPFFQRWFEGSRMVDKAGRPIAFVHRSFGEKVRFDDSRLGGSTGTATAALGHFLARQDVGNVERYGPVVDKFYVRMRKPKVITQQQFEAMGDWSQTKVEAYRKTLMEQGHDGLYIQGLAWPVVFEGKNIKAARNAGTFDESDQVRYSLAQDAADLFNRFGQRPADVNDPFAEENRRLREQDKTLWSRAKQQFRRQFAPGGLLPQAVFGEKVRRDSEFQAVEFDVRHMAGGLEQAVKADFGVVFDQLPEAQMKQLAEALAGRVDPDLPQSTREAVVAMRQYIDSLSGEYIDILQQQIEQNLEGADPALMETISRNIGSYVNRSYRAFDDAKWFEKVPTETLNAARRYLASQYRGQGASEQEAGRLADLKVNELLKTGTAYSSMESMIAEGKLGAKDLSLLIKRKEIAPEIRALLGEYIDPRVNFAKSATKMGRLIWNQRFLDRVRAQGMGAFLFEEQDRPAGATEQLAGEQSDTYAPLNGLWTFPEVAQSFRDAMGKEQMSDLYRAIVRLNGMVKYGKTVLSPTTAMRNWQSAMFFSLANGHFDLTQMKKSLAAFREQVSQSATGEDLAYLRKLKQLGVVYDTPYAGEMARLLEDARLEELLDGKTGTGLQWLRKINQVAQGFYSFGDDFWKIIGFENEKAGLQRAGFNEAEAERMAAERIRNTYPTYSMVGRGIDWLRRFPLMGTFVSFPAEVIRTSANMLRLTAADLKSDNPALQALGRKRAVGMAMVSAGFYALSAMTAAAFGVDDDEEEALRDLAPEWQKNSTFLYSGRDADGKLRYFDMSFLDPYGYWKRPLTAMLRDQPWEKAAASGLGDMLAPFLGADITAGAIFEAMANKTSSGGQVYQENGDPVDQALDIADHLRKALQPGFVSNAERLVLAGQGVRREGSGQAYDLRDEVVSLLGWRASTTDPRTALHYRAYDFGDALAESRRVLTRELRSQNKVDEGDIRGAWETADQQYQQAFREMGRLVQAAQNAGMSRPQAAQTLRMSGVSSADVALLLSGNAPRFRLTSSSMGRAVQQARLVGGLEHAAEVAKRYRLAMQL